MDGDFLWICSDFIGLYREHGGIVGDLYVYRPFLVRKHSTLAVETWAEAMCACEFRGSQQSVIRTGDSLRHGFSRIVWVRLCIQHRPPPTRMMQTAWKSRLQIPDRAAPHRDSASVQNPPICTVNYRRKWATLNSPPQPHLAATRACIKLSSRQLGSDVSSAVGARSTAIGAQQQTRNLPTALPTSYFH